MSENIVLHGGTRSAGKSAYLEELLQDYRCDNLTDRCAARDSAKGLQLLDGMPMCERVCCIGCDSRCGYACGLADSTVRELAQIAKEMEAQDG